MEVSDPRGLPLGLRAPAGDCAKRARHRSGDRKRRRRSPRPRRGAHRRRRDRSGDPAARPSTPRSTLRRCGSACFRWRRTLVPGAWRLSVRPRRLRNPRLDDPLVGAFQRAARHLRVYTVESLQAARRRLSDRGGLVLYFRVGEEFIDLRIRTMITEAFGEIPSPEITGSLNVVYVAGPPSQL